MLCQPASRASCGSTPGTPSSGTRSGQVEGETGSVEPDGGTVSIDDTTDALPARDTADLPWVNGPQQTLDAYPGTTNRWAGTRAFAGDSYGWVARRADLSAYAGKPVKLQFSMLSDATLTGPGWWLDDVSIYTCDPGPTPPPPTATPTSPTTGPGTSPTTGPGTSKPPTYAPAAPVTGMRVLGRLGKAVVSWKPPTSHAEAIVGYRVMGGASTLQTAASTLRATVNNLRPGRSYALSVTPLGAHEYVGPPSIIQLAGCRTTLTLGEAKGRTTLRGQLRIAGEGVAGREVTALVARGGRWSEVRGVTTHRAGRFSLTVPGADERRFRVRFAGGVGVLGCVSPVRHG